MKCEKRPIRVVGEVAYVTLTNGRETIIDAADISLIEMWNWCTHLHRHTAYAARFETREEKRVTILMHRVISFRANRIKSDASPEEIALVLAYMEATP